MLAEAEARVDAATPLDAQRWLTAAMAEAAIWRGEPAAALARLALGSVLPLWVLDEPFSALDSAAIAHLQSIISQHLANSGMVVMTTHQDVPIAAPAIIALNLDQRTH